MFYILLFVIFLLIFYFFSSQYSPIPYFPSNMRDLPMIVESMQLQNDQQIFDLGAGDGTVIFALAKDANRRKLNTVFVAIDINPVLCAIMWLKKLFHPHRKYIHIVCGDIFEINYSKWISQSQTVKVGAPQVSFFIYISPWFTKRVAQIVGSLKVKSRLISYFYPVEGLKNPAIKSGLHDLFIYNV